MFHVLIFSGGLHPSQQDFASFMAKTHAVDFIIAADSGLETAIEFGFEPDLIVGDMDSLKNPDILKSYNQKKIMCFSCDKDKSDTEIALDEAHKRNADFITLCGADGGRIDHLLAILKLFEGSVYPNVWLCKEQIVYSVGDKTCNRLELSDLQPTDVLSVFSIKNSGKILSTGLQWSVDEVDWQRAFSLSNRICDNYAKNSLPITLDVTLGHFLVIISYP
ncbi:MAG: thiamine diphosphokinase [Spirochaetales bacterium]